MESNPCNFHEQVFLDENEEFRVNANCYSLEKMVSKNWFVLPPVLEYYYARKHPEYKPLPPFMTNCESNERPLMEFVYPNKNEEVLLPKDFDSTVGEVVFQLAHKNMDTSVFWYLNDTFIEKTTTFHELSISPSPGEYLLTVVDENGNRLAQKIEIKMASEHK